MPNSTEPKHTSNPQNQATDEEKAWLDMAPLGHEFGSPDYERLTALDQAAFAAFRSWDQVRDWLATPNPQLDGICPEDAAQNPDGLTKVMSILMMVGDHTRDDFMREAKKISAQERDAMNVQTEIKNVKGMFDRPSNLAAIETKNSAITSLGVKKK